MVKDPVDPWTEDREMVAKSHQATKPCQHVQHRYWYRYCVNKIYKEVVDAISGVKIPYMLNKQLKWVTRSPPSHAMGKLAIGISTQAYRANNIKLTFPEKMLS